MQKTEGNMMFTQVRGLIVSVLLLWSVDASNHSAVMRGKGKDTCMYLANSGSYGDGSSEITFEEAEDFELIQCVESNLVDGGIFSINTRTDVTWPAGGFCKAFTVDQLTHQRQFEVSANLWNQIGRGNNHNFGHPGLAFNAKDDNNYDFIYFRPHSPTSCYQYGYVEKGVVKAISSWSKACPNGPPAGRRWFRLKIAVLDRLVRVFKNDVLVVEFTSHFSPGGAVGVVGANGYQNEIRFENLKLKIPLLTQVSPPACPFYYEKVSDFSLIRCSANSLVSRDDYLSMTNAPGVSFTTGGFCRAVTKTLFRGFNHYMLSVYIYNELGRGNNPDYGHPGILFNGKDHENFDVLYFRPHSVKQAWQVGYVSAGKFKTTVSRPCPRGPPKGRTWFLVELFVQDGRADVYLDGHYVTQIETFYGIGGHVGVIAANGYENTVFFRNLHVYVPEK